METWRGLSRYFYASGNRRIFHVFVDKLLGISENRPEEGVEKIIEECSEYDTHYGGEDASMKHYKISGHL